MNTYINGKKYLIIINRKDNLHTYIRVKEDLCIHVSTSYFTTLKSIEKLIEENKESLSEMIKRIEKRVEKKENFYFLGKKYDLVIYKKAKEPLVVEDKIYIKNMNSLNRYLKAYTEKLLKERLDYNYSLFESRVPYPKLTIRKMKQKWGYCNKEEKRITLNSNLIKYLIDDIDYVIVHELCHFIEFNHSALFWSEVKKYKSNYKINRKNLREE